MDEGNAKNYNYKSDDSGYTDNDDARDGNSSNGKEGNEAYRCVGRRGLLITVSSRLKPRSPIYNRLRA
jgi:hypothetical protein